MAAVKKIHCKKLQVQTIFLFVFTAGFLAGILLTNFCGKNYVQETGILSQYFIQRFKQGKMDSMDYFYYLLTSRSKGLVLLWIFGTTMFGIAAVYAYLFWFGLSGGILLTSSVMNYGMKGIVVCVVSGIPQYLFYIPLGLFLLRLVYQTSAAVYFPRMQAYTTERSKGYILLKYTGCFCLALLGIFIGIWLESWLNPVILKKILKIL